MNRPDPVSLYETVLRCLGMDIVNGLVSEPDGQGGSRPATIRGKRIAVPTRQILETADWGKVQAFHPLCENAEGSPSAVLKNLSSRINLQLNARLANLLLDLAGLAADPVRHNTLSPAQTAFLSKLPDMDEKTVERLGKLILSMENKDVHVRRFINIYSKRGGTINNKGYCRTAISSFPIVEDFERPDSSVWDIEVGKRRKHALSALFRLTLRLDQVPEHHYSTGSDSTMAPFFDALMQTYIKFQTCLNEMVTMFDRQLPGGEYSFDTHLESLIEQMRDLTVYKGLLPVLSGNDRDDERKPTAPAPMSQPGVAPVAAGTTAELDTRRFPPGIRVPTGTGATPLTVPMLAATSPRPASSDDEVRQWVDMQTRKALAQPVAAYHPNVPPAVQIMRGQQQHVGFATSNTGPIATPPTQYNYPPPGQQQPPWQPQQQQPPYPPQSRGRVTL